MILRCTDDGAENDLKILIERGRSPIKGLNLLSNVVYVLCCSFCLHRCYSRVVVVD